ncbi:MAG: flotillin-like FloA family protein, partial [Opitutales bacterium]
MPPTLNILAYVAVGALLLLVLFLLSFLAVWVRARLAGAEVGVFELVGMRLRGVPYSVIVDAKIAATKAGLPLEIDRLDAHFLAGGNVVQTVQALIAAQKAGLELDWNHACAIDIATRGTNKSVLEAVLTSVSPKVIDCPNPASGRVTIDAVAKDGIQVKVKARVTVRTSLSRFVGGAQEETIVARVGEGIVTTIGSADSYKHVLENPDRISKTVLSRGLDDGTAYQIISIDIAAVDVGDNVGAMLQEAPAQANKN